MQTLISKLSSLQYNSRLLPMAVWELKFAERYTFFSTTISENRVTFEAWCHFRYKDPPYLTAIFKTWKSNSALISLMPMIECKYCLISTSYLVGLSDIFILLHISTELCVFWCLFINEDTLWCLSVSSRRERREKGLLFGVEDTVDEKQYGTKGQKNEEKMKTIVLWGGVLLWRAVSSTPEGAKTRCQSRWSATDENKLDWLKFLQVFFNHRDMWLALERTAGWKMGSRSFLYWEPVILDL